MLQCSGVPVQRRCGEVEHWKESRVAFPSPRVRHANQEQQEQRGFAVTDLPLPTPYPEPSRSNATTVRPTRRSKDS